MSTFTRLFQVVVGQDVVQRWQRAADSAIWIRYGHHPNSRLLQQNERDLRTPSPATDNVRTMLW